MESGNNHFQFSQPHSTYEQQSTNLVHTDSQPHRLSLHSIDSSGSFRRSDTDGSHPSLAQYSQAHARSQDDQRSTRLSQYSLHSSCSSAASDIGNMTSLTTGALTRFDDDDDDALSIDLRSQSRKLYGGQRSAGGTSDRSNVQFSFDGRTHFKHPSEGYGTHASRSAAVKPHETTQPHGGYIYGQQPHQLQSSRRSHSGSVHGSMQGDYADERFQHGVDRKSSFTQSQSNHSADEESNVS